MIKENIRYADGCVFEGMISLRAILSGISSGVNQRRIKEVLIDRELKTSRRRERDLAYIEKESKTYEFTVRYTGRDEIDEICVGSTHGGIAAFCTDREISPLDENAKQGFFVMLEGIEDPYNFGYAIRSLYAAGADGIVLSPRNWMTAAGVVCRSSAGASEMLPMYISSPKEAAEHFRQNGVHVVCADQKNSVPPDKANLSLPLFLIVGGEKRGLSSAVLSAADEVVRIEYARPFPAALSAASAATILGYEVQRRNTR